MIYALIIVLGLVMGSFFLVIGERWPKGESIIKPRSHCDKCGALIKWYELIPVFSYLFLKGRCNVCHQKISILCPLVEIGTSLCFLLSYLLFGFSYETIIAIIISSVMIIILISDFKYMIILDSPIFVGSILVLLINYLQFGIKSVLILFLESILLFLFILLIKIFGDKFFKRESLGGGDVKLGLFMGTVLGIKLGLFSFILSSFLALPYCIYLLLKHKNKEIPFGPFLIIACFLTYIFNNQVSEMLLLLFG